MEFSAKMRLDESIPMETKQKFVDQVLKMLELDGEADLLVGNDNTGGLSFEQKKRLSIAVELAANPSIIFLDEVRNCVAIEYPYLKLINHLLVSFP